MSQNSSNTASLDGHLDDEDHLKDANRASAICIPPVEGNGVFDITRVMIYLI